MSEDKSETPGPKIREVNSGEEFALFPTPESIMETWSEGLRDSSEGKRVSIFAEFKVKYPQFNVEIWVWKNRKGFEIWSCG